MDSTEFICFDCGLEYGHQKHNNSTKTSHMGTCDICGRYTLVANPQEWGGIRSIIDEEREE